MMYRAKFLTGLAIAAALIGSVTAQGRAATPVPGGITLKSESLPLPAGSGFFPGGKAADAINGNCLTCHSTDMVLNQPALSRATWDAEVHKMIKVYKAPVSEQNASAIIAYLAATKGAP